MLETLAALFFSFCNLFHKVIPQFTQLNEQEQESEKLMEHILAAYNYII